MSWQLVHAQHQTFSSSAPPHPDQAAIEALAQGQEADAERWLLSRLPDCASLDLQADRLWLLSQIAQRSPKPHSCGGLIRRLAAIVAPTDGRLLHLSLQTARLRGDRHRGPLPTSLEVLTDGAFPHLDLEISAALLRQGQVERAALALKRSGAESSCEGVMLQAQLLLASGQRDVAETLLLQHWPQHQHRLDYGIQLIELLFELRRGDTCLPVLKQAISAHPHHAHPLLERFAQARMLQRQPGVALRLKLQERLPKIAGARVSQPTLLASIYDSLGRADWLAYLSQVIEHHPAAYLELHSIRLMHLSSRGSAQYPEACQRVVALLSEAVAKQVPPLKKEPRTLHKNKPLRIGWVCADIANHPVARFLLSWLAAAHGNVQHEHLVIATVPPDPRYERLFRQLEAVAFIDQSAPGTLSQRIERLRALDLDLAVDLNGWTGNHLAPAWIARVAPIQINYLAYHASTGIPAIDTWVVDQHLLPATPNCEWHSEELLRLARPFLAWQPHPGLPEANAAVAELAFSSDSGIRFGCFNHLRKISNEALHCWANILRALPSARLVLKAHSSEDHATATLLKRRLERSGLPLEQVIWLPYTATPDEHLQHYGHMDVALDSFPNTGCTTTCEALWMGVPVITLEGTHYVSRMASAVLHGAQLHEWICTNLSEYEHLAIEQAEPQRLSWLRQHRPHWRQHLQQSPLGDARDLMQQLESSFSDLAQRRLKKEAFELTTDAPGLVQR